MVPMVLVGLGSALGGMARYGIALGGERLWGLAFPWSTLLINVLGSFVIGWFATITAPAGALPGSLNMRVLVMIGVCGGFTTFSSFSLQTVTLLREGQTTWALANIALSVLLCLGAVALGQVAGR